MRTTAWECSPQWRRLNLGEGGELVQKYQGRLFCRSYIVAVSSMTSRRFWRGILGGKKDSDICEAARQEVPTWVPSSE